MPFPFQYTGTNQSCIAERSTSEGTSSVGTSLPFTPAVFARYTDSIASRSLDSVIAIQIVLTTRCFHFTIRTSKSISTTASEPTNAATYNSYKESTSFATYN